MLARRVHSHLRSPVMISAIVAVLTAGQGIVIVALRSERWAGHWPNSSVAVGWATLLGAPIAAGVAAWLLAAPKKLGFSDLLAGSSRPVVQVHARGLLAVASGNLAGYAVVAGYISVVTAPLATRGHPQLLEILPALATVPAAIGVGAAIGRIAPPVLAPLIAGLLPYLAYALAAYGDVYIGRSVLSELLAIDAIPRDYLAAPAELLVLKTCAGVVFGFTMLSWALNASRTAYAGALVSGVSLAAVLLVAGVRTDVPEAYEVVCLEGEPVVCLDRARDHLLEQYRAQVEVEYAKVPGLDLSGRVVVPEAELFEIAIEMSSTLSPPFRDVDLLLAPISKRDTGQSHKIDKERFAAQFGYGLFQQPCFRSDARGTAVGLVLYKWWLTTNGLATDGSNFPGEPPVAAIIAEDAQLRDLDARFLSFTLAERETWFLENGPAALNCSAEIVGSVGRG